MKRVLLLLAALISTSVLSAQEFVYDTFYNLSTEEIYDLEVYIDDETGNISHIFIEVDSETGCDAFIKVKVEQLNNFHNALRKMKSKFLEWEQVANDNNVSDYSKEMEIDFPAIEAYWYDDSDWKDSFASAPTVMFSVDEDGDAWSYIGDLVEDWEDDDYYETYILILGYGLDFDDLIQKTTLSYIRSKINEIEIDSLFEQGDNVDALFT